MIRTSCHVRFYFTVLGRKVASLLLATCLYLSISAAAHADSPLQVTHQQSFGPLIVGAVKLQLDTIKWIGNWSPDYVGLIGTDPAFGFTGNSIYNDSSMNYPANTWRLSSLIGTGIKNPAPGGSSPAMGFWFSPDREGAVVTTPYTYSWNSRFNPNQFDNRRFSLKGEGIPDDKANPNLLLEVTTLANVGTDNSINLGYGGEVRFEVTARSLDVSVEHVMVTLNVAEKDGCSDNRVSFEEKVRPDVYGGAVNDFVDDADGYLHYIVGYDPDRYHTSSCIRQHNFIVSVDKPFIVEVDSTRIWGDAHAKYDFFIRGHYDASDESLWPGSHHSYMLTTDDSIGPVNDSDGDGIVDSEDNCPNYYDVTNNCNYGGDNLDSDGDGILDKNDNCPNIYDPTNLCNDGISDDDSRPRLLWPYSSTDLYLLEGEKLDVSSIGGCEYDSLDWLWIYQGVCVNSGTNVMGPDSEDAPQTVTLSSRDFTGPLTVTGVSDPKAVSSKADIEAIGDDEPFKVNLDFSVFDQLNADLYGYRYWIQAYYGGQYYFLHKNQRTWVPVTAEKHLKFFGDGDLTAIPDHEYLFAVTSGTMIIEDLFTKAMLEDNDVRLYYGVMPFVGDAPRPSALDRALHVRVLFDGGSSATPDLVWSSVPFGAVRSTEVDWTFSTDDLNNRPMAFWVSPAIAGSFERTIFFSPENQEEVRWEVANHLITASGSAGRVKFDTDISTVADNDNVIYMIPGRSIQFTLNDATLSALSYDSIFLGSPTFPSLSFSSMTDESGAFTDNFMLGKGEGCTVTIDTLSVPDNAPDILDYGLLPRVSILSRQGDCIFGCSEQDNPIPLAAPLTYDAGSGELVFQWPLVDPDQQGSRETLETMNNKCFRLLMKNSNAEFAPISGVVSLSDLKLYTDMGMDGAGYTADNKMTFTLGGANGLLPPGIYFAQVVEKDLLANQGAQCTESDFDNVPWGVTVEVSPAEGPFNP